MSSKDHRLRYARCTVLLDHRPYLVDLRQSDSFPTESNEHQADISSAQLTCYYDSNDDLKGLSTDDDDREPTGSPPPRRSGAKRPVRAARKSGSVASISTLTDLSDSEWEMTTSIGSGSVASGPRDVAATARNTRRQRVLAEDRERFDELQRHLEKWVREGINHNRTVFLNNLPPHAVSTVTVQAIVGLYSKS
jgi:hypothetical protein